MCASRCGSVKPSRWQRETTAPSSKSAPPDATHAIADTLESAALTKRVVVTSATNRVEDQTLFFHSQLAALGVTAPEGSAGRLVDIPPTPWLHSRYWMANRPVGVRVDRCSPVAWGAR